MEVSGRRFEINKIPTGAVFDTFRSYIDLGDC
jgi:hypothetical protein